MLPSGDVLPVPRRERVNRAPAPLETGSASDLRGDAGSHAVRRSHSALIGLSGLIKREGSTGSSMLGGGSPTPGQLSAVLAVGSAASLHALTPGSGLSYSSGCAASSWQFSSRVSPFLSHLFCLVFRATEDSRVLKLCLCSYIEPLELQYVRSWEQFIFRGIIPLRTFRQSLSLRLGPSGVALGSSFGGSLWVIGTQF